MRGERGDGRDKPSHGLLYVSAAGMRAAMRRSCRRRKRTRVIAQKMKEGPSGSAIELLSASRPRPSGAKAVPGSGAKTSGRQLPPALSRTASAGEASVFLGVGGSTLGPRARRTDACDREAAP